MSKAVIRSIITLLILSVFTLVPTTGVAGGAGAIGKEDGCRKRVVPVT
jgi:hypothetical protein